MLIFVGVLLLIFSLGYLAQTTGLCMVRGVNEWKNGDPTFLLAILTSGVLAWVAVITGYYLNLPLPFRVYEPNILFAVGGLLFGIGTAFNQGCGVSTHSKLSRGDLSMTATVFGWLAGWTILATWRPEISVSSLPLPTNVTYGALIVLSLLISIWAFMAMGGNDSQLLLALPTFSLAGVIAISGMVIGLFIGLDIRKKIVVT